MIINELLQELEHIVLTWAWLRLKCTEVTSLLLWTCPCLRWLRQILWTYVHHHTRGYGPQNILQRDNGLYGFSWSPDDNSTKPQAQRRRCSILNIPSPCSTLSLNVFLAESCGTGREGEVKCSKDAADIWAVMSGVYWTVYALVTALRII